MNRPTPSPKRYYQYPCMGLLLLLENIANDYEWAHCFSWEMLLMPLHGTIAAAQIYCWCIWIGKGNWKCCAPTQREGGAFDPNHWKNLGFDARRPACWTGRGGVCWVCHWKKKTTLSTFSPNLAKWSAIFHCLLHWHLWACWSGWALLLKLHASARILIFAPLSLQPRALTTSRSKKLKSRNS